MMLESVIFLLSNSRQQPETAHDMVGFSADDLFCGLLR